MKTCLLYTSIRIFSNFITFSFVLVSSFEELFILALSSLAICWWLNDVSQGIHRLSFDSYCPVMLFWILLSPCLESIIKGNGSWGIQILNIIIHMTQECSSFWNLVICLLPAYQFSSVAQSCPTLQPHGLQHTRPPCPSPIPRAYSNSYPSCQWCKVHINIFIQINASEFTNY